MARTTVRIPGATEETTLPRGKRSKRGKAPTKLERLEKLRERILSLGQDLLAEGFGAQLPPPGPIRLTAEAIRIPKPAAGLGMSKNPWAPTSNGCPLSATSRSAPRSIILSIRFTGG